MLLAVEGGGFFSASASGYSKGLTLLFSGDRPMSVVPWNHYQAVVDPHPLLQLDSIKNRVSRGCASFTCFCGGGASAGLETPTPCPLTVEPLQQHCLAVPPVPEDHANKAGDSTDKEAFKLSLRSSLKRPSSLAESRSLEDIKEYETLSLDHATHLTGADMGRRKVQWPDACGSELTQVREFEPSIPEEVGQVTGVKLESSDGNRTRGGCEVAFLTDEYNEASSPWSDEINPKWFHEMKYSTVELKWEVVTTNTSFYESLKCGDISLSGSFDDFSSRPCYCDVFDISDDEPTHLWCACTSGYEGNPYLPDGYEDINECDRSPGPGDTGCVSGTTCLNTQGSFQCVIKRTKTFQIYIAMSKR